MDNIKSVFSLMDKAEKSSFNKIEIEIGDIKLKLDRSTEKAAVNEQQVKEMVDKPASRKTKKINKNDFVIAPISGVFYTAKAPGEPPFVSEGSKVRKGDPVCIIEAMKTMNEIVAPKTGVIESVLLSDSEPVNADQPMFKYIEE